MTKIAVLTFDGFNEIDSFVVLSILNRMKPEGWVAFITSPSNFITSVNGVQIQSQKPIDFANDADVVVIGSGSKTREHISDEDLINQFSLNPKKQIISAQCSGTMFLVKLGLIYGQPVCTDWKTKPIILESGIEVLEQPFVASGNIGTAGGCLSSLYLATWIIAKKFSCEKAKTILSKVAPVGEVDTTIAHSLSIIKPFL